MAGENDKETRDERDEDERDDSDDEGEGEREGEGTGAEASSEDAAPDPNVPRNRAERRAATKAARRGRQAKLADDSLSAGGEEGDDPNALVAPTTSMGGDPKRLDETRKPKVPPRTMARGTGTSEGVPEWALAGGDWFSKHRTNFVAGIATVAVVSLGFFGWQAYSASRGAKATGAYNDALGAVFGMIAPEDLPAEDPRRDMQRFATFDARARAALEKLRKTARENSSARVIPLVRLTEAGTLYQLGRYAEAKQAYLAVIGQDLVGLEGRAIEGLAFTLESLGELDAAMARYRELQNVQDGIYRDQAQYYQARLMHRRNEGDRAKEMLRAVMERVGRPAASDPTAGSQSALRESALGLLRDIDPNDPAVAAADRQREAGQGHGDSHGPPGGGPGGRPGGLEGLPPELRQQLEKMLRERGGAGGAGAPGAPGGGAGAR